jgi:CheW-like protein
MSEPSAIGSTVTGIRCRIGRAEVALPLAEVGQIIEYPVFPLPLARRWIGGLGLHEDRPLVSVALARLPDRVRGHERKAQGILLQGHGAYEVDWALEVDELGTFLRATLISKPAPSGLDVPVWISQARDDEGKTVGWIDVPSMLADLTSGEGR